MFENLAVFRMAGAMAENAALRQSAVARNIANADTPGYKAVDAPSFAEAYRAEEGLALRRTRPGHLEGAGQGAEGMGTNAPATGSATGASTGQVETRLAPRAHPETESPNGNTVSLENEMVVASEMRQQHDMALAIYKSAQGILRSSLGRNG